MCSVVHLAAILALAPRVAWAHDLGVSRSDFVVEGRWVRASLVLARADADAVVRGGSEADARDVVAKGMAIDADGEACEGALDSAGVVEGDGYAIDATFACTHPPHALAITMYLVSELPRGHRHLARAEAGASASQAILDAEHRQLTLTIDTNLAPEATPTSRRLMFVLGIAIALAVTAVMAITRLRRSRARS